MHPQPSQPNPIPFPGQLPAPGPVKTVAVMLWITVAVALVIFTINMAAVPFAGVEPGYAFGYSIPWTFTATLLGITAIPIVRGRAWARTMAKVVLIIQIVLQSLMLLSGTGFLWALVLLPAAITALIQLRHPESKWFFAANNPATNLEHLRQSTAGYHPQPPYPPQGYNQQPPQHGSWNQHPHQQ